MRSVLIVFGIAIGILVLSFLFTPRKGLVDNPAEVAYEKQQAYEKQEQAEAAKAAKNAPVKAGADTKPPVSSSGSTPTPAGTAGPSQLPMPGNTASVTAVMSVKGRGDITLELFAKEAPKTVAHFEDLVKRKFYDGILFHRVVPGFVAQAGDPASKSFTSLDIAAKDDGSGGTAGLGAGGSGTSGANVNIPFEANKQLNETGTLAMALSGPRSDTGDSQFFVNLKPNTNLDGDYCVFGRVTSGMDVVNKIERGDVITKIVLK